MAFLLPQLLGESARRFPEKDAVVYQQRRISYADLDELSNRLANFLKRNGVQRGDRVGIYINKSIEAVLSIFGILKADAVYVPLDPFAPVARLDYIIKNCNIRCLLSASNKSFQLPKFQSEGTPLEKIILTDEAEINLSIEHIEVLPWNQVLQESPAAPSLANIETDLAYILYTSGSTGDPKGVMISHLNAFTFINWAFDTVQARPEDRISSHAPFHFDLSIFDIFVTMKAGATLCLIPTEVSKFPVKLSEFVQQQQISIWYSVPSAWVLMLNRGKMEDYDFSRLHTIIFAGEVFPTKHLRRLMQRIPHAKFYNWYGPTETNVITSYQVEKLDPENNDPIPIGKACRNMEVFLLDEDGKLVNEPGKVGELYGRGSGVAQGYWNDPEKTARLFVRNPIQPHYHDRTYRTGDLVKLGGDGNYYYLGRRDHQVKVQGYRIELGEIETALFNHAEVEEAAVVALKNEDQVTYLKAFVVLRNSQQISDVDLKRHCAKYVPKYMIPEVIEFKPALPKTSTGKTDKKRLALAG